MGNFGVAHNFHPDSSRTYVVARWRKSPNRRSLTGLTYPLEQTGIPQPPYGSSADESGVIVCKAPATLTVTFSAFFGGRLPVAAGDPTVVPHSRNLAVRRMLFFPASLR